MSDTRIAPHDLDAEAAVLALLMHSSAATATIAADLVAPEEMCSEAHRRILAAIYALAADSSGERHVDAVTVSTRLREEGRLQQVGGMQYLTSVIDAAPAISNESLRAYAATVRQCAQRRALLAKLQELEAKIYLGVPDHDAFMHEAERGVSDIVAKSSQAKRGAVSLRDGIAQAVRRVQAQATGNSTGVPTGIASVDRLTGGMHATDLIIIAARPGMGKTSLALNVVDNVSSIVSGDQLQHVSMVFSLEMPTEQLAGRMLCGRAGVNVAALRNGCAGSDVQALFGAAGHLAKLPVYIDDTASLTVEEIRARTRHQAVMCQRVGQRLALVVIDYLQIINLGVRKGERHDTAIGRVTSTLKQLAKELSVPVVLLSQLNRDVEKRTDKRPLISDLKDSGSIEQDADNVLFIYREDYYAKTHTGKAEIIIAKQRNGPTGTAEAHFDGQSTTFRSKAGPGGDGGPWERAS